MAPRKKTSETELRKMAEEAQKQDTAPVTLTAAFTEAVRYRDTSVWLIGTSPLITHAWSHKNKESLLRKHAGGLTPGRQIRNPEQEFIESLYEIGNDPHDRKRKVYGFPAMGVKNALLSVAHKDKGLARTTVMQSVWIHAPMVRTRPALSRAICDMPLLRIYSDDPEMREDMVKIGAGLNKTANLAYRAQFTYWGIYLSMRVKATLPSESLAVLFAEAGISTGIGEWRNEKKGTFGMFRLAKPHEVAAWDDYRDGKGPLPKSDYTVHNLAA